MNKEEMDRIVALARQNEQERLKGYREQSLRVHPWVCARCGREFTVKNLHLLTVHHKDHDHENNPPDGSNWENLCIYCHDHEHSKYMDYEADQRRPLAGGGEPQHDEKSATYKPFARLADLMKTDKD
jgi:5-methylcytosine-specific restriction endonuclease McrA